MVRGIERLSLRDVLLPLVAVWRAARCLNDITDIPPSGGTDGVKRQTFRCQAEQTE